MYSVSLQQKSGASVHYRSRARMYVQSLREY